MIEAYRAWIIVNHDVSLVLASISTPHIWWPGVNKMTPLNCSHTQPDKYCTCGLYAVRDWRYLWKSGILFKVLSSNVIGKVKLWGQVIEHEFGYRAEYGRVIELYILLDSSRSDRIEEVAKVYDIPAIPIPLYLWKEGGCYNSSD